MAYRHGIFITEEPSALLPVVSVNSTLPVVFGTAPVNLATAGVANVNTPVLCNSYAEAVAKLGYSDDWDNYTLCEVMNSHFTLYGCAPVVFVNVLDPTDTDHKEAGTATGALVDDILTVEQAGIIKSSVVVKVATVTKAVGTDYELAFDEDGYIVVERVATGTIVAGATLDLTFNKLKPAGVTASDIIGGVGVDLAPKGLEVIEKIFPVTRLTAGLILAPKWSMDASVAQIMAAKADSINGMFKAFAITDLSFTDAPTYADAPSAKVEGNYTSAMEAVCWGKVKNGTKTYHMSTHVAGILCKLAYDSGDIPTNSPGNQSLVCTGIVDASGNPIWLSPAETAYLEGQGICSAMNFIGGFRTVANRTAAYPDNTDPKDAFNNIRLMFNYLNNTIILSTWQRLDRNITRRLIDTIVDSLNAWLNGLKGAGYIAGGQVQCLREDNSDVDIADGKIKFKVSFTPYSPAREIDFTVAYDATLLGGLFE